MPDDQNLTADDSLTPQTAPSPTHDAVPPAPLAPPACGTLPFSPGTWGWLAALIGWTLVVAFYGLGADVGLEPVEAWVAQPAREMQENIDTMLANREQDGWDWRAIVIPQFSGEVRLQKSPGAYWTVILTAWARGVPVDEFTARLPNACAAVIMVLTVFWLTRRIGGDRAAIFAGFATASSTMFLHWSHNAASDMGVAALITLSLACLWVGSECEPPGRKRVLLWLAGYLFAGLAMIYKMPLPVPCIGIPALLYVLLRNRWRIFASWWHVLGLLLFLLPWLPWALAAWHFEPMAIHKWRVEYLDRVTGELPNVQDQSEWWWNAFYGGVALLLSVPYALSVFQAIGRGFRPPRYVNRNGMWFVLIWFVSLLLFFTLAVGKETRYFLPAMPPLFVLLGIELSEFFDSRRIRTSNILRTGAIAVYALIPAGMVGLGFLLHRYWSKHMPHEVFSWDEILYAYLGTAILFGLGAIVAASLYRRCRGEASFGALVVTMWLAWLWTWPNLMPILAAQAPFRDLAVQLERLTPEQQSALVQVAHQDPRYIWYSDIRFPRIIDQLELLDEQDGKRNVEYEKVRVGEEMMRLLTADKLALMVIGPGHYLLWQADGRHALEEHGKQLPKSYPWIVAQHGRWDRRYMVIGNQTPPWEIPALPDELKARIERRYTRLHSEVEENTIEIPDTLPFDPTPEPSDATPASSAPTSQPASAPTSEPAK